jgi:hypothetical protein
LQKTKKNMEKNIRNEEGGNESAENQEEKQTARDARIEPDAAVRTDASPESLAAENQKLKELLRLSGAREHLIDELRRAGARSPGLLFAQAADGLQFDDEGRVANSAATVEKLKRLFPEQFGRETPQSIDAGAGGNRAGNYLTKEALAKMTPAEIAQLDWAEVRRVLANG